MASPNTFTTPCTGLNCEPSVLLMVGDDECSSALRAVLDHFVVRSAATVAEVRQAVAATPFDVVIVDPTLAGGEVLPWIEEVRRMAGDSAIFAFGSFHSELDRVRALRAGADDVVSRPHYQELLERLHLRITERERAKAGVVLQIGPTTIDLVRQTGYRGARRFSLTRQEVRVLSSLAQANCRPVARSQLMREAWGYLTHAQSRALDSCILQLRKKIETDAARPAHLITVRNVGYALIGRASLR